MKKILKRSLLLLSSGISFLYPVKLLDGCGGGFDYPESDYHFLIDQEMVPQSGYESFLLYYPDTYYPVESNSEELIARNVKEWSSYFNGKVSDQSIRGFVYDYSQGDLRSIIKHVERGQESKLPADVLSFFKSTKDLDAVHYILLVRDLAPFVTEMNEWEGCNDKSFADGVLLSGEKLLQQTRSEFIRIRVAYQLSRLAQYTGLYEKSIAYYDTYIGPSTTESLIKYMALGHKAGSLKAMDRPGEAAYYFSIVVANSPEKREAAQKSIWFSQNLDEALSLCKNNQEKVSLYFLSQLEGTTSIEPFNLIYDLKPDAKELDILVMREVKKYETQFAGFGYGNHFMLEDGSSSIQTNPQHQQLKALLVKGAQEGKVRSQAMWYFLAGYVDFLNKDFESSKELFQKALAANGASSLINDEIRIVQDIIKLEQCDTVDVAYEDEILKEFSWMETMNKSMGSTEFSISDGYSKARTYMLSILRQKYHKQGDIMKSVLANNAFSSLSIADNVNNDFADSFIAYFNSKNKSPMERYLGRALSFRIEQMYEIKGMVALRNADFKNAVKYFQNGEGLSASSESFSDSDPFEQKVNVHFGWTGSDEATNTPGYSRLAFAQKMLEYEKLVKSDRKNAAYYYCQLGNGMFNTTYYGASYNLTAHGRSFNGPSENAHIDCSKALHYYQQALKLAKDKELAAKACYMAAKCQSLHGVRENWDWEEVEAGLRDREYFILLKEKYSETKYYSEIIKECSYFAHFAKHY